LQPKSVVGRVRRLLVIDDSPVIRQLAAALLGRRGWDVQTADSGEAGIEIALEARLDGILLDVDMPGLDGLATLERLRGHPETAGLAVAFLTAAADELPPDHVRSLGAQGVIAKPLNPATAASDVSQALGWTDEQR
jgi:CheY-like chemotaxis protein